MNMKLRQIYNLLWLLIMVVYFVFPTSAYAHVQQGQAVSFMTGLEHPWSGLDHVLAMIAVGLWGAQLGNPAIWILPITFPMVMSLGAMMGLLGIPLPGIEIGIAVSAIVLGIMVLGEFRLKLVVAAIIVGCFAVFHGHAHGTELPGAANPLAYSAGFVISTGMLHLSGIAFGLLVRWPAGKIAVRTFGVIISLAGVGFLTGII